MHSGYILDQRLYSASPWLAVFGIMAGGLAAAMLVPSEAYFYAGALALPGIALSTGLLLAPAAAALHHPKSLFRTENILTAGLIYWLLLDTIQASFSVYDSSLEGVHRLLRGVVVFATFLWVGSWITTQRYRGQPAPREATDRNIQAGFLFAAACACYLLMMLRILIGCQLGMECMLDQYLAPRFGAGFVIRNFGNWDTILIQMKFFGYLILPLAVALHHAEKHLSWRVVVTVVLGVLALLMLIRFGGRRGVGTVLGASILMWLLLKQQVRLRHLIFTSLAAGLLLILMQAMLVFRTTGVLPALMAGRDIDLADRGGVIAVDKNFLYASVITSLVPEFHPHTGMSGVIYAFTAPIPRSVFPGKPASRGFDLRGYAGMRDIQGFSWTASVVGDMYLIGGYWALALGGLFYGMLANLCSRMLFRQPTVRNRLMFALCTMTLFVGLRSFHELSSSGLAVLALWGLLVVHDRWVGKPGNLPMALPASR